MFTFKHYKYIYSAEQCPIETFKMMILNINDDIPRAVAHKNNIYLQNRSFLMKLLKAINTKFCFTSNTYFTAVYFMDFILYQNIRTDKFNDLLVIALSSLIIAGKFIENESLFPSISDFIDLVSVLTHYKYQLSCDNLHKGELFVLKSLNYQLKRYSIYHFIYFFFTHGVLINDNFNYNALTKEDTSTQRLLEKIYSLSRVLLDLFIEGNPFCFGSDCYLTAISILRKAIDVSTKESNFNKVSFDVFKEIYNINDINENQYSKISNIVNYIYNEIQNKKINNKSSNSSPVNQQKKTIKELKRSSSSPIMNNIPKLLNSEVNSIRQCEKASTNKETITITIKPVNSNPNEKLKKVQEQFTRRQNRCNPSKQQTQIQYTYYQNQNYNSSNVLYYNQRYIPNQSNYRVDSSQYGAVYDNNYFCFGYHTNIVNNTQNSLQFNSRQRNGVYMNTNSTYPMYYINNNMSNYCVSTFY